MHLPITLLYELSLSLSNRKLSMHTLFFDICIEIVVDVLIFKF